MADNWGLTVVGMTASVCFPCIAFTDLERCLAFARRVFLGIILTLKEEAVYKFWYLKYMHDLEVSELIGGRRRFVVCV